MFEFYKKNPTLACRDLLNQDLAPFQRIVINGIIDHSYVVNVLARGSGKTRIMGVSAALLAMFNPKIRIGFLAPGFRQSKLAFMELENIINESPYLKASLAGPPSKQTDMWVAKFNNEASIIATPLAADNPASIRGIRLHVAFLDEYPHIPKEVIDAVINPMLATQRNPMKNVRRLEKEKEMREKGLEYVEEERQRNKIIGFSSAYYQFNHMYKTICDYKKLAEEQKAKKGKSDYAVYVFNYKDAPEGFFDTDSIDHAKRTSADIIFRMEYLSEFPADSEGFYKRSLIDSCIPRGKEEFYLETQADSSGFYVLGIDPARLNDAFSISILKLVGVEMRLVRVISFEQTPLPLIAEVIRKLIKTYKVSLIGMDAGGGGLAMKDLLSNPLTAGDPSDVILDMDDEATIGMRGTRMLKMVNFATQWISDANFEMRSSMEHKKLLFPAHFSSDTFLSADAPKTLDEEMLFEYFRQLEELQSIVMTATKAGSLHFDTPNQRMRKDRYTSLLIAHKVCSDFIKASFVQKELVSGGWLDIARGRLDDGSEEHVWEETKILDEIESAKAKARVRFIDPGGGALV